MANKIISKIQLPNGEVYDIKDEGAKTIQAEVSSPTASGAALAFIDTISQNTQGVITATKKTVANASTSAAGLMSADDKTKLAGIAAGAQVNSITGVKGDAESSYRTGNVNLTPANIGALSLSGGTMTGGINFSDSSSHLVGGAFYAHDANGTDRTYLVARTLDSSSNLQLGVKRNSDNSLSYHITNPAKFRQDAGITPTNIGAVDKTGDTMTGNLNLSNAGLHLFFTSKRTKRIGYIYGTVGNTIDLGRVGIGIYAQDDTTYPDFFLLPEPTHRTTNGNNIFELLSTKNAVTIPQGGTGATTAAAARTNLSVRPYIDLNVSSPTISSINTALTVIPNGTSAGIALSEDAIKMLTGSGNKSNAKITVPCHGFVWRLGTTDYRFSLIGRSGNEMYGFYITVTSSSIATGEIYKYTGTKIT